MIIGIPEKHIPNILTVLRILLIPILIMSFYISGKMGHYVAATIFIFASLTDYFDGYLARALEAHTDFGRMLDPIADKLLVASALMMLVHFDRAPVLPAIAILCREILVSGLREYLADSKVEMPVTNLSKIKTAMQMVAIVILLLGHEVITWAPLMYLGHIAIWVTALLTLFTGYVYLKASMVKLR